MELLKTKGKSFTTFFVTTTKILKQKQKSIVRSDGKKENNKFLFLLAVILTASVYSYNEREY